MKKVLIALDYNPSAQKVAETGYALAKSMNAEVVLLHVVSDAMYYTSRNYSPVMGFENFSQVVETESAEQLKKAAQGYLDRSKQHLGDEKIQTTVKSGAIGEAVLEAASDWKADIIVMGTHSRRGLEKILMGSVAESVLRHSSIPMLIIPTKEL